MECLLDHEGHRIVAKDLVHIEEEAERREAEQSLHMITIEPFEHAGGSIIHLLKVFGIGLLAAHHCPAGVHEGRKCVVNHDSVLEEFDGLNGELLIELLSLLVVSHQADLVEPVGHEEVHRADRIHDGEA